MDINWSRYIEIARAQDLGSAEVARLIRTETRRKVNISEVKRRLSVSESAAAQIRQPNSLDVIIQLINNILGRTLHKMIKPRQAHLHKFPSFPVTFPKIPLLFFPIRYCKDTRLRFFLSHFSAPPSYSGTTARSASFPVPEHLFPGL